MVFDIQDTGIGLTEQQLSRLFRAFEQADTLMTRKFGGTGLGLRISKRLAMMIGGDISVTSTLGKGSTFSVSIATGDVESSIKDQIGVVDRVLSGGPVVEMTAAKKTTSANRNQLTGLRILLAEYGPDNQRLITFLHRTCRSRRAFRKIF